MCIVSMTIMLATPGASELVLALVPKSPSWHWSGAHFNETLLLWKVTALTTNNAFEESINANWLRYLIWYVFCPVVCQCIENTTWCFKVSFASRCFIVPIYLNCTRDAKHQFTILMTIVELFEIFWNERISIINSIQQKRFWFKDIKKDWWLRDSYHGNELKHFSKETIIYLYNNLFIVSNAFLFPTMSSQTSIEWEQLVGNNNTKS